MRISPSLYLSVYVCYWKKETKKKEKTIFDNYPNNKYHAETLNVFLFSFHLCFSSFFRSFFQKKFSIHFLFFLLSLPPKEKFNSKIIKVVKFNLKIEWNWCVCVHRTRKRPKKPEKPNTEHHYEQDHYWQLDVPVYTYYWFIWLYQYSVYQYLLHLQYIQYR